MEVAQEALSVQAEHRQSLAGNPTIPRAMVRGVFWSGLVPQNIQSNWGTKGHWSAFQSCATCRNLPQSNQHLCSLRSAFDRIDPRPLTTTPPRRSLNCHVFTLDQKPNPFTACKSVEPPPKLILRCQSNLVRCGTTTCVEPTRTTSNLHTAAYRGLRWLPGGRTSRETCTRRIESQASRPRHPNFSTPRARRGWDCATGIGTASTSNSGASPATSSLSVNFSNTHAIPTDLPEAHCFVCVAVPKCANHMGRQLWERAWLETLWPPGPLKLLLKTPDVLGQEALAKLRCNRFGGLGLVASPTLTPLFPYLAPTDLHFIAHLLRPGGVFCLPPRSNQTSTQILTWRLAPTSSVTPDPEAGTGTRTFKTATSRMRRSIRSFKPVSVEIFSVANK